MSLKIRLSRGGTKKRPFYRIVVADARMPRDGRFVEKIGTFDPLKAKDDASRLVLDQEKAKAWLAKGAQPTDRVLRLLDGLGLAKREAHNNPKKALPKKKAQERAAAADGRSREGRRGSRGLTSLTQVARARPPDSDGRVRRAAGRACVRRERRIGHVRNDGPESRCEIILRRNPISPNRLLPQWGNRIALDIEPLELEVEQWLRTLKKEENLQIRRWKKLATSCPGCTSTAKDTV